MSEKQNPPERDWKEVLTEEQFRVCREKGTERAFSGEFHDHKENGAYFCVCCQSALFDSESKFDSGTGWPSFSQPKESSAVGLKDDNTLAQKRTEVVCANCDAHLGHVFNDGPAPTGKRYCINSVALGFKKDS